MAMGAVSVSELATQRPSVPHAIADSQGSVECSARAEREHVAACQLLRER